MLLSILLDNRLVRTNRCEAYKSTLTAVGFDNHLTTYMPYFAVFLSVAESATCTIWSKWLKFQKRWKP